MRPRLLLAELERVRDMHAAVVANGLVAFATKHTSPLSIANTLPTYGAALDDLGASSAHAAGIAADTRARVEEMLDYLEAALDDCRAVVEARITALTRSAARALRRELAEEWRLCKGPFLDVARTGRRGSDIYRDELAWRLSSLDEPSRWRARRRAVATELDGEEHCADALRELLHILQAIDFEHIHKLHGGDARRFLQRTTAQ